MGSAHARREGRAALTPKGRAAVAALVLAASVVSLSACTYSGDATVENKTYIARHSVVDTVSNGKYSWPQTRHVPEQWVVTVRGEDGKDLQLRVNQDYYDSLDKGERVQIEDGEIAD